MSNEGLDPSLLELAGKVYNATLQHIESPSFPTPDELKDAIARSIVGAIQRGETRYDDLTLAALTTINDYYSRGSRK